MNSGQYYQVHGNPMNVPYPENPDSLQSIHQVLYDGLPRAQSDPSFLISPLSTSSSSGNYTLANFNHMATSHLAQPWMDQNHLTSSFEHPDFTGRYSQPNFTGIAPDRQFLRGGANLEIPRRMPDYMGMHGENGMIDGYHDDTLYTMHPNSHDAHISAPGQPSMGYSNLNSGAFARLSIDGSMSPPGGPKMECDGTDDTTFDRQPLFRLPSIEASEDGGHSSREMTAVEGEEPAADEPYAKLIYRALMSASNHSMVLQEIYQWFRENTVKGSSDTKGWMNSIRHNLSMNAAFKKTERKVPGDDSKKSTEWVLEEFAVKDGVQSTTRYRKGTNAKKFVKSDHPAPSKQRSGREGGLNANKNMQRHRGKDRFSRRPVHMGYELKTAPHYTPQRQRSPLTPPHPEHILSPPRFCKPEQLESHFEEPYSFGDVQGVYNTDDGPIFAINDQEPHFHNGLPMSNHSY